MVVQCDNQTELHTWRIFCYLKLLFALLIRFRQYGLKWIQTKHTTVVNTLILMNALISNLDKPEFNIFKPNKFEVTKLNAG